MNNPKLLKMLCLGDSYTIGEQVEPNERFASFTSSILQKEGIVTDPVKIIAKTGWTTDELLSAIESEKPEGTFNIVTLLIGVNNQYRGRDPENYRHEFNELLKLAISFAGQKKNNVFVLSIPDWGVTPFAAGRDIIKISTEIDHFNAINRQETSNQTGVHYIDITGISRKAASDPGLLTGDNLHPSGKMYEQWAQRLSQEIIQSLKQ